MNLEAIIRKEIGNNREIYTNASPTKRAKLLEVYPVNGRLEVILEVVESEYSSDAGIGNRFNLPAEVVAKSMGY